MIFFSFLNRQKGDHGDDTEFQIINKLQDIIEIIIQDVMNNGHEYVYQKIHANSYAN